MGKDLKDFMAEFWHGCGFTNQAMIPGQINLDLADPANPRYGALRRIKPAEMRRWGETVKALWDAGATFEEAVRLVKEWMPILSIRRAAYSSRDKDAFLKSICPWQMRCGDYQPAGHPLASGLSLIAQDSLRSQYMCKKLAGNDSKSMVICRIK